MDNIGTERVLPSEVARTVPAPPAYSRSAPSLVIRLMLLGTAHSSRQATAIATTHLTLRIADAHYHDEAEAGSISHSCQLRYCSNDLKSLCSGGIVLQDSPHKMARAIVKKVDRNRSVYATNR